MPKHNGYDIIAQYDDITIVHDPDSDVWPIGVYIDNEGNPVSDWFDRESGIEAAKAILNALDASPVPAGLTPASSISYNEGALRLAAVHGVTVCFRYAKGDGTVIESRRLIPESVSETRGHLRFVGFDPDREDFRAYRVDRIKGTVEVQA